jgi:alpha-galactosidase/6-phospho-beta-glucosidase family protein
MATICRAITRGTRFKTIGLCYELFGTIDLLQAIFDCLQEAIKLRVGGAIQLLWVVDLKVNGEDGFAGLRDHLVENGLFNPGALPFGSSPRSTFVDRWAVKTSLLLTFGALPAAGDRHVAAFFAYFATAETG